MMETFIAARIMEARDAGGVTAGQAKYSAYFVNTTFYAKWQPAVNTILETSGYGDCIVTA